MSTLKLHDIFEEKRQKENHSQSYFCTWQAQNDVVGMSLERFPLKKRAMERSGKECEKLAVNMLDEDILFGKGGFAEQYPRERDQLYFMLDYGWDIPYLTDPAHNMVYFGGHELNLDRFPSFTGTPAERLKKLNAKIQEYGWRGLGIWVPSQPAGVNDQKPFSPDIIDYWRERILWSKEAGIRYWKLDLGAYMHDPEFRRMLTELGRELYPELCIEQTICPAALNGNIEEDGRFADEANAPAFTKLYANCDLFRSGDVSVELGNVTSIDRIAHLLKSPAAIINCECNPLLGASLGHTLGIMRSELHRGGSENGDKLGEITAALNWHRFAPPFEGGTAQASTEILLAQHTYGETWVPNASNKTVTQGAPAIFARSTPLPTVMSGKESCYVTASQHPNGAYAVAFIPRPTAQKTELPLPTLTCYPKANTTLFGVFGNFEALHLQFENTQKSFEHVYAQSLIEGEMQDITAQTTWDNGTLTVKGATLQPLTFASDASANAVAILLK